LAAAANAQEKGMQFEHNTSWEKVLAKAKAENKYIFVDCYTTWCGPCKMMSSTIFPQAAVGYYYNARFVNAKVQMDKTDKDNDDVKSWYANAQMIENKYDVHAYPTYLIFNPSGEIVHRFVGSMSAEEFLAKGKDLVIPEKQYYTQLRKYQAGEKSTAFLYQLALLSGKAYDMKNAKTISDEYLATQKNLYTKENLELLKDFTSSSKDKGFAMMVENPTKVDAILGEGTADKVVNNIILREEVMPKLFSKAAPASPDWASITAAINAKYPSKSTELTAYAKVIYYQNKKEWNNFGPAVNDYMKAYGSKASPEQMNQFAWSVFENCNDMTCVESALAWSKKSFEKDNNHQFMDTYANLLMKAGKKQEAIEWETKAVAIAKEKKDPQVGEYEGTLEAMKNK
jgi:thiol-disulfide isomerase/thioredoxin